MTTVTRHTTPARPEESRVTGATANGWSRAGHLALTGLRLAIGFEFFWAFIDKLFGLGYATPSAKAWIHGGSPTNGFLSGVSGGPLRGLFNSLAGHASMDWLFMAGLLGIGAALLLGVALRPAAAAGSLLLMMMWFASWVPDTMADGVATHSTNPIIDDHIVSTFALIAFAGLAVGATGYLGRRWDALPVVSTRSWLR